MGQVEGGEANVRSRPTRGCRLCSHVRPLCDSHLLPAAAYKVLRAAEEKNPNPVLVTPERAGSTSRQFQDYLLCGECEARFRRNGEDWTLAHCHRGAGEFRLREILERSKPDHFDADWAVFAGARIPELDMEALTYFALSVFWRAAVHRWRMPWGTEVRIELGPYEVPLRRFLLGTGPFPADMALVIRVSALRTMLEAVIPPESNRQDGYFIHMFQIPGIAFGLSVGRRIPEMVRSLCSAPSPDRFIYIMPELDVKQLRCAAELVATSERSHHVRGV
jgi:hypothetical protein